MPAAFSQNLAKNIGKMLRDRAYGPKRVHSFLSEALEAGKLKPEEFSIKAIFEETVEDGREMVRLMDPRHTGGYSVLQEAGDAVSTSHFANITGQIVYSKIMEAAMVEDNVFSRLIPTVPTVFDGEKIPGVTNIGDKAQVVEEGKPYQNAGVVEDWIETPSTVKRGNIVPVTKEAVFFDRTNMVLRQASAVGQWLGVNKEKRLIDCVIDENVTEHRHRRKGGAAIATYGDNSGAHDFDNLAGSNSLVDYASIKAAEDLLSAIVDPNTGEPMPMYADTIIVPPGLEPTAWGIINAFMRALSAGGFPVTGNPVRTDMPNSIGQTQYSRKYNIVSSRQLAARMGTDTYWYLGRPSEAFAYMENWPITVTQAPTNSDAEFERDIVAQFKASERGAAATLEPRYMVKNT